MLGFRPITLHDKSVIEFYLKKAKSHFCDHCFVDIFIWSNQFQTQFCIKEDFLFLKVNSLNKKSPIYLAPIGQGNFTNSINMILEDTKVRNTPLMITCLSQEQKKELEHSFTEHFTFEELRDSADYIYNSCDLIFLKGNKLHSKRNHINRFMRIYENRWRYEGISSNNMEEVMSFYEKWRRKNSDKEQGLLKGEEHAVRLALGNFAELNLQGGLLRLDDNVIAFTLGAQSTEDMFVIQVEKADPDIPGAYQMINQQFAMANCKDVQYINREEDLGIEGLRKSKLSYHPAFLEMKYIAKASVGVEL